MKKIFKVLVLAVVLIFFNTGVSNSTMKSGVYCISCGAPSGLCSGFSIFGILHHCENSELLWNCCGTAFIW